MQFKNSFDTATIIKIVKGAMIAGGGALIVYLLHALSMIDYGTSTPIVTAVLAIIINAVNEYRNGQ
jgi:hypothetical protein